MNFIDSLRLRYTTKIYDTTKELDEQTILDIANILRLTPSSINSQPWQFTFVSEPETKAKLAESSFFNQQKINQAPLLIVFSAADNLELFESRISKELPEPNVEYYKNVIKSKGEEFARCWMTKQLYIAIGVLLSGCATMGLDSTPMEGIDSAAYDLVLENKDYHATVAVAVGYRHPSDENQPQHTPKQRRPLEEVVLHK